MQTMQLTQPVEIKNSVDRYTLHTVLSRCAGPASKNSIVYKAYDQNAGRFVAYKALAPKASKKLRREMLAEARLMRSMRFPGIPKIHDYGIQYNHQAYYTMPLLKGQTLAEMMKKPSFSWQAGISIIKQLCGILEYTHRKGIVHNKLSPQNIFVTDTHEVFLLDWSEAVQLPIKSQDKAAPSKREKPSLYISPEHIVGKALTPRADQYALGVMFYELLTGSHPFFSKDLRNFLRQVCCMDPIAPSKRAPNREIPQELDAICMRLLAKQPRQRFQSPQDIFEFGEHTEAKTQETQEAPLPSTQYVPKWLAQPA